MDKARARSASGFHPPRSCCSSCSRGRPCQPWLFVALTLLSVVPTGYLASRLELKTPFVDLSRPRTLR
ncbi:MAG: hypothetical protein IPM79_40035 [Polyangiaceae bacterium]|nr:hypothetical protein [Polyangiaceae bacterium]